MNDNQSYAVPLLELLRSVPRSARLEISEHPFSTRFIPVGRYCHEAADALASPAPAEPAQQAVSGVLMVQEGDTVPFTHPQYGPGIFFTEDALIAEPAQQDTKSLLRVPLKQGERLVCYCPPGICQAPKGFSGPCNRASDTKGETWTLRAPDGREWRGATKLQCMAAETSERVPATVQLGRIMAAVEETRQDEERECREAYDNTYHKVKADMGYDDWRRVWFKAQDASLAPKETSGSDAQQDTKTEAEFFARGVKAAERHHGIGQQAAATEPKALREALKIIGGPLDVSGLKGLRHIETAEHHPRGWGVHIASGKDEAVLSAICEVVNAALAADQKGETP